MRIFIKPCCPEFLYRQPRLSALEYSKIGFGESLRVERYGLVGEDGGSISYCPYCGSIVEVSGIDGVEDVGDMGGEERGGLYYLACPYSHADASIRSERYRICSEVAYSMILEGKVVFSPLSHSVGMLEELGVEDGGWEFWRNLDLGILGHCDGLVVLTLEGWQESLGVLSEIGHAESLGIPVVYRSVDGE